MSDVINLTFKNDVTEDKKIISTKISGPVCTKPQDESEQCSWIVAVADCIFHPKYGPYVSQYYSKVPITTNQKSELAFLAFPDSGNSTNSTEELFYVASTENWDQPRPITSAHSEISNNYCCWIVGYKPSSRLYLHVLFSQDTNWRFERGADQTSRVILSYHLMANHFSSLLSSYQKISLCSLWKDILYWNSVSLSEQIVWYCLPVVDNIRHGQQMFEITTPKNIINSAKIINQEELSLDSDQIEYDDSKNSLNSESDLSSSSTDSFGKKVLTSTLDSYEKESYKEVLDKQNTISDNSQSHLNNSERSSLSKSDDSNDSTEKICKTQSIGFSAYFELGHCPKRFLPFENGIGNQTRWLECKLLQSHPRDAFSLWEALLRGYSVAVYAAHNTQVASQGAIEVSELISPLPNEISVSPVFTLTLNGFTNIVESLSTETNKKQYILGIASPHVLSILRHSCNIYIWCPREETEIFNCSSTTSSTEELSESLYKRQVRVATKLMNSGKREGGRLLSKTGLIKSKNQGSVQISVLSSVKKIFGKQAKKLKRPVNNNIILLQSEKQKKDYFTQQKEDGKISEFFIDKFLQQSDMTFNRWLNGAIGQYNPDLSKSKLVSEILCQKSISAISFAIVPYTIGEQFLKAYVSSNLFSVLYKELENNFLLHYIKFCLDNPNIKSDSNIAIAILCSLEPGELFYNTVSKGIRHTADNAINNSKNITKELIFASEKIDISEPDSMTHSDVSCISLKSSTYSLDLDEVELVSSTSNSIDHKAEDIFTTSEFNKSSKYNFWKYKLLRKNKVLKEKKSVYKVLMEKNHKILPMYQPDSEIYNNTRNLSVSSFNTCNTESSLEINFDKFDKPFGSKVKSFNSDKENYHKSYIMKRNRSIISMYGKNKTKERSYIVPEYHEPFKNIFNSTPLKETILASSNLNTPKIINQEIGIKTKNLHSKKDIYESPSYNSVLWASDPIYRPYNIEGRQSQLVFGKKRTPEHDQDIWKNVMALNFDALKSYPNYSMLDTDQKQKFMLIKKKLLTKKEIKISQNDSISNESGINLNSEESKNISSIDFETKIHNDINVFNDSHSNLKLSNNSDHLNIIQNNSDTYLHSSLLEDPFTSKKNIKCPWTWEQDLHDNRAISDSSNSSNSDNESILESEISLKNSKLTKPYIDSMTKCKKSLISCNTNESKIMITSNLRRSLEKADRFIFSAGTTILEPSIMLLLKSEAIEYLENKIDVNNTELKSLSDIICINSID